MGMMEDKTYMDMLKKSNMSRNKVIKKGSEIAMIGDAKKKKPKGKIKTAWASQTPRGN